MPPRPPPSFPASLEPRHCRRAHQVSAPAASLAVTADIGGRGDGGSYRLIRRALSGGGGLSDRAGQIGRTPRGSCHRGPDLRQSFLLELFLAQPSLKGKKPYCKSPLPASEFTISPLSVQSKMGGLKELSRPAFCSILTLACSLLTSESYSLKFQRGGQRGALSHGSKE